MFSTHLGCNKSTEELLKRFLRSLEMELRKMKFPNIFVGGEKELRYDTEAYLRDRSELNLFKSDKAKAEALAPEYLRTSALRAVDQQYESELQPVLHLLAGILQHWMVVAAVAKAVVASFDKKNKAKPPEDTTVNLPLRYFFHIGLPATQTAKSLVKKIKDDIQGEFRLTVSIEEVGWLSGSITNSLVKSSGDGLFVIVWVKDSEVAANLKGYFEVLGCEQISTPQMFEIQ